MAYCTIAEVTTAAGGAEKLAQIADTNGDGVIDNVLVQARIDEAEGLINAYLGRRYPLDGVAVTPFLRRIAAQETVFLLLEDRGGVTEKDREAHLERLSHCEAMRDDKLRTGADPKPVAHDGAVSTDRELGEGGRDDYKGLA